MDFFIIGAQKAGTTYIQNILQEHPDIFMPWGETILFDNDKYNDNLKACISQLFPNDNRLKGIKRPDALFNPKIPQRIYNNYPNSKLIVVLRNPVERFVSAYFHYIKYGVIPITNIELGIKKILSGEYDQEYPRATELIEFGYYAKYIKNYFKYFRKENILIINYDELKKDKSFVIKKVYSFLGVNHDYSPKKRLNNKPMASIYSIHRLKFLGLRNSFMYNYENSRVEIKNWTMFDKSVIYFISLIDMCFLSFFYKNIKPKLSYYLVDKIYNIYREDLVELEKEYKIKFDF